MNNKSIKEKITCFQRKLTELNFSQSLLALTGTFTCMGRKEELSAVLELVLENDLDIERYREIILQSYLFGGFPRTINALTIIKKVCKQNNIPLKHIEPNLEYPVLEYRTAGKHLFERIYRDKTNAVYEQISSGHPEFADWIYVEAYGKVLSRPGLNLLERELAIVLTLGTMKLNRQLLSHLRGVVIAGANKRLLLELVSWLNFTCDEEQQEYCEKLIGYALEQ